MAKGQLVGICIARTKGVSMESLEEVRVIAGQGLADDRYTAGEGSWNKARGAGHRQVTMMCARAVETSSFSFEQTRRGLLVDGIEIMMLIGREFTIGGVRFRGTGYCDPCGRPSKLAGKTESFQDEFWNNGGIIAEVLQHGTIHVGDEIIYTR